MSSSSTSKSCQATNDCKQKAVGLCDGCQHWHCYQHFDEHRQSLGQQIDSIIGTYDEVQSLFAEKSGKLSEELIFEEISRWEKKALDSIQQRAAELRRQVTQLQELRINTLSKNLSAIAKQLRQSQKQKDFVERDLENWREKLAKLKSTLEMPALIKIELHDDPPKIETPRLDIKMNEEVFDRAFDSNVELDDEERTAISTDKMQKYTEIRGRLRYEFGRHQIRIRMEHKSDRWVFLGITSASTPLQKDSWKSLSTYGWCSDNYAYSRGDNSYHHSLFERTRIRMEKGDVITLIFHCEAKKISMINERTQVKHELDVDLEKCPLPWQLHVIVREKNTHIRLVGFPE